MRFWGCVPTAAELESPKLPPRMDRDVILRSPPPPPRLSKEEKAARGVLTSNNNNNGNPTKSRSKPSHQKRSKSNGSRKTRSKHPARARRISSSSSSSHSFDGADPIGPLGARARSSGSGHLPEGSKHHSRSGSLAQITGSSGSSRPPSRANGEGHHQATPRSSPGTSSGFSSGGFSGGSGSVIGTGPRQPQGGPQRDVHFRSPSDQTPSRQPHHYRGDQRHHQVCSLTQFCYVSFLHSSIIDEKCVFI